MNHEKSFYRFAAVLTPIQDLFDTKVILAIFSLIKDKKCWFDLKSSQDINTLISAGWINREPNNCFSIHPVISDIIRYKYPVDYSYSEPFIKAMDNYILVILAL